jgi:energy-coupling factor transport system ATP-binding protein
VITISNLSFTYPGARVPALQGVTLQIPDGELCLVMGPSGSGKSTLLRCINGLVPHFSGGSLSGKIRVNELDPAALSPREMSRMVGFVFQDPETQFVVDRVEDEIAFSLENTALPREEMENRVQEAMSLLELTSLRARRLDTLSGGEMQRVAIAAALVLKPSILVLDEPTSQLDPHSAEEVLEALVQLNLQLGLTVILAEHRLERVLPHTDRIIYLSQDFPGGLSGSPRDVLSKIDLNPPMVVLGKALSWKPLPLTVAEAQRCAEQTHLDKLSASESMPSRNGSRTYEPGKAFILASGVTVSYGSVLALRGVDLSLYPGEIAVMMGLNGAGKSTLLRALIGLTPLKSGSIQVDGKDIAGRSVADICQQVGYLPQDPNALLFADKVKEELSITLRNHHLDGNSLSLQPEKLLYQLGIGDKADAYPRDLSTGERQRVALGAVMVTHPGALLLDEPTRGLDYAAKQTLLALLKTWRSEGMAILLVTHDVELAVQAADRIILLENGMVPAEGVPAEVLARFPTFASQVAKIFPGRGWLTVNDVLGETHASQH